MENRIDCGAGSDGERATEEIQEAIDACAAEGGGTVRVSPGEYRVGTIALRSGVCLHLESGAEIRGSADPDEYVADETPHRALLTAVDADDVGVTGHGTIHCNGLAFMDEESVVDPRLGHHQAVPAERSPDGPLAPDPDRPTRGLLFYRCSNVTVRDVTIRDSPHWTLHLLCCDGADVRGVDLLNDVRIPNSDGINPDMSRNVHISDCTVHAGDDAICVKADGRYPEARPCENVTVTNCTLRSRSCGIKLGSESEYDIRNCHFANCTITDSNRGLGIQNRDAGDIERIHFSDISVETRHHTGNWWGVGEPVSITSLPRTRDTDLGTVRDVRLSNVTAEGEGTIVVYADPSDPIRGLRLDGVCHRVTVGEHSAGRNDLDLRPTQTEDGFRSRDLPAIYLRGVERAVLHDVTVEWDAALPFHTHALEADRFRDLLVDGFRGRHADAGPAIALRDGTDAVVRRSLLDPEADVALSSVQGASVADGGSADSTAGTRTD